MKSNGSNRSKKRPSASKSPRWSKKDHSESESSRTPRSGKDGRKRPGTHESRDDRSARPPRRNHRSEEEGRFSRSKRDDGVREKSPREDRFSKRNQKNARFSGERDTYRERDSFRKRDRPTRDEDAGDRSFRGRDERGSRHKGREEFSGERSYGMRNEKRSGYKRRDDSSGERPFGGRDEKHSRFKGREEFSSERPYGKRDGKRSGYPRRDGSSSERPFGGRDEKRSRFKGRDQFSDERSFERGNEKRSRFDREEGYRKDSSDHPKSKRLRSRSEKAQRRYREEGFGEKRGGSSERSQRFGKKPGRERFAPARHSGEGKGGNPKSVQTFRASVDKNRKGFAFLVFEGKHTEDLFVPAREARDLFHGDRVEVRLGKRGDVLGMRVVSHRFKELVGRFSEEEFRGQHSGSVIYEKKNTRESIVIPKLDRPLEDGDWIKVRLHFHQSGSHRVTAEVLETYGQELPASADIELVATEYGLLEHHTGAAKQEAKSKKLDLSEKGLKGRQDLRDLPFVTIDGETARDFDDAVFVERNGSGYTLWVAIADVSHYVSEGTILDSEAYERATSVYFPERAFHMLPSELSENLCSLRPNEPRMAMVAQIDFDSQGNQKQVDVFDAVIESKRRATYNEIEKEYQENFKENKAWAFAPHFELFSLVTQKRVERGSIDFDLPEPEVIVDEKGEPTEIRNRERLGAHRLIETFMIAANEAVTDWMMKRNWPFVYRIHDEPSGEALEKFVRLAKTVGIPVKLDKNVSPKEIAEVVSRLEGHPAQALLNQALLRSLKQAIYSESHGIHFGLASPAYTHFTSPIRRYPDLIVHRLLKEAIQNLKGNFKKSVKDRENLEKKLKEQAEHCSFRERLAADAERESLRLKQVRMMSKFLGEEFDAKVVGVISSGVFAQVAEPFVEGLVTIEALGKDYFEYLEDKMIIVGRRSGRTFRVGDSLRIRVVRTDLDKRQIDFSLVDSGQG